MKLQVHICSFNLNGIEQSLSMHEPEREALVWLFKCFGRVSLPLDVLCYGYAHVHLAYYNVNVYMWI